MKLGTIYKLEKINTVSLMTNFHLEKAENRIEES